MQLQSFEFQPNDRLIRQHTLAAILGKQQVRARRRPRPTIVQHLDRFAPGELLRGVDLAQIQHVPLHHATARDSAALYDAPIMVQLAVFSCESWRAKTYWLCIIRMHRVLNKYLVFTTHVSTETRVPDMNKIKNIRTGRPGRGGLFRVESAKFGEPCEAPVVRKYTVAITQPPTSTRGAARRVSLWRAPTRNHGGDVATSGLKVPDSVAGRGHRGRVPYEGGPDCSDRSRISWQVADALGISG